MRLVGVDMVGDGFIRRASIHWRGDGRCNSGIAGFRHQVAIQYMGCLVLYARTVQIVGGVSKTVSTQNITRCNLAIHTKCHTFTDTSGTGLSIAAILEVQEVGFNYTLQ